ncbi:MAG: GyrI-like domain-containing protein [Anaerolineales bacterium]|jgi:effector-binding domain-containing protein
MTSQKPEFRYKKIKPVMAATKHIVIKSRSELPLVLNEFKRHVPEASIAGPGICIIQFVTSVQDGLDVEIGYPVTRDFESDEIETRMLPEMGVLTFVHKGKLSELGDSYRKLYAHAYKRGLISDEFCREVYHDIDDKTEIEVEIQFVIHQWNELFAQNLKRVLGDETEPQVMQGSEDLDTTSTVQERFNWTKGAVQRLEQAANAMERYDILSSCAHVFPVNQIAKLRAVYQEVEASTADALSAVDAVLEFMKEDPGWGEAARREGMTIYAWKNPRDPAGYEKAQDPLEKRKAACFCPILRENMEEGMPGTFCYCGAGWYRQQWEGAIGRPVTIEIVSSLLMGDERCEFAIRLPDDLWHSV